MHSFMRTNARQLSTVYRLAVSYRGMPCALDGAADFPRRSHSSCRFTSRGFHHTPSPWNAAAASSSPSKRDYYEVLGVSRDAAKGDIKKHYYQLAKKFHPDTNKHDPATAQKFAEATEAWEVLGDAEKRKQYDTFGHGGMGEGGGFDASNMGGFEDIFGDFSSMFGNQRGGRAKTRSSGRRRGADMQVSVRLSFMEAVKGTTRDINFSSNAECTSCKGSGAREGTKRTSCRSCNGSGVEVIQQVRTVFNASLSLS
jgi:DnaJ-class molecular chaperone